MSMDSIVSGLRNGVQEIKADNTHSTRAAEHFERNAETVQNEAVPAKKTVTASQKNTAFDEKSSNKDKEKMKAEEMEIVVGQEKEPSKSSIESTISEMNAQLKLTKTRCAYDYDEDTKRITIKVYDEENDELIREVPPEKSLEVLKRIWEMAGIMVDEKR